MVSHAIGCSDDECHCDASLTARESRATGEITGLETGATLNTGLETGATWGSYSAPRSIATRSPPAMTALWAMMPTTLARAASSTDVAAGAPSPIAPSQSARQ